MTREQTATLSEQDIERFRRSDILLSDEQANAFCDLALKALRGICRYCGKDAHGPCAQQSDNSAPSATTATWIPVGERVPSPYSDNDFICATRSGYVCALHFGEHGWYDSVGGEETGKDGYWNGCVTHWQEMPSAPAEEKATTL